MHTGGRVTPYEFLDHAPQGWRRGMEERDDSSPPESVRFERKLSCEGEVMKVWCPRLSDFAPRSPGRREQSESFAQRGGVSEPNTQRRRERLIGSRVPFFRTTTLVVADEIASATLSRLTITDRCTRANRAGSSRFSSRLIVSRYRRLSPLRRWSQQ